MKSFAAQNEMERSCINRLIDDALAFMRDLRFQLPPFAAWTPEQWQQQGPECQPIVDEQLGWDVTDFGTGEFDRCGLVSDVRVTVNSIALSVAGGEKVVLKPGDSICLPPRLYHAFWAAPGEGPVLAGEVSSFNDDRTDNHFYQPVGRFPEIEEDEKPRYLLVTDYPTYYRTGENQKR